MIIPGELNLANGKFCLIIGHVTKTAGAVSG